MGRCSIEWIGACDMFLLKKMPGLHRSQGAAKNLSGWQVDVPPARSLQRGKRESSSRGRGPFGQPAKSTLFYLLAAEPGPTREVSPSTGWISPRFPTASAQVAQSKIGFVFQKIPSSPTLSARSNMRSQLTCRLGAPRSRFLKKITECSALRSVWSIGPTSFPAREQQRVALARSD